MFEKYLLDASALIPANRTYYDLGFCPAFWDWLKVESATREVFSIEHVAATIKNQDPELRDWMTINLPSLFVPLDHESMNLVREIVDHVNFGVRHTDAAKDAFNNSIYPFMVAYAKAHNCAIVTLERSAPSVTEVVRLPDVCRELGVNSIDTFEMLRRENPSFVLG